MLRARADQIVELYVFNTASDVVRVVTLLPTYARGGRGLLGAEVGTGHRHRFPWACRGTDGVSVARKLQPGARPMEAALRTTDGAGEGWEEAMGAAAAGEGNVLRTPSGGVLRFAESGRWNYGRPC